MDFIKQIKAAYGDYITVIGSYTDETTLQHIFSELPGVTSDELETRIATSHLIN